MKDLNLILGFGVVLALTGCPGDDSGDEGADSGDSTGTVTTTGMDSTGDPPGTTTDEPGTTTDEPGTTTDEPGTTTDEPGTTTDEPGTSSGGEALSFEMDVWPILEANCLGAPGTCHSNGAGTLDLQPGDPAGAYGNLVDVAANQAPLDRIEPGAPMDSYLFHKLNGTQADVGGSGMRMPRGMPPLDAGDIGTVEQWINDGAQP